MHKAVETTSRQLVADTRDAVRKLSSLYGFPLEEALEKLSLSESPAKRPRTDPEPIPDKTLLNVQLPWCGVIVEECCYGIRYNKGLFTQCTNKVNRFGDICPTCDPASGKRSVCCGDVRDRGKEDWSDNKGRKPVRYCKVMTKAGTSKERAQAAAEARGWTIPEIEFEEAAPARRGRPPKTKPLEVSSVGTDMLDELVRGARNLTIESPKRPWTPRTSARKMHALFGTDSDDDDIEAYEAETESEGEDEAVPARTTTIDGKEYLFEPSSQSAYEVDTWAKAGVTTPGGKHWLEPS